MEILWNSCVTALRKEKYLTGIELENVITGESCELSCDGLFVAVGRVPDTALFTGELETDKAGYLTADESCRTNVPGVFAAGDVRTKALRQIVTAAADGANAAHWAEEHLLQQL